MIVGVTGGIGSGKSSVCRVFNNLGIPVFDADNEARKITESDQFVMSRLSELSGMDLYTSGSLDRRLLASLIFNDRKLLAEVNLLIHPLIFDSFRSWVARQQAPYVIMEAAILFESGAESLVDKTVSVTAPEEERIERVVSRNNLTIAEVRERIRNQLPQEELIKRSDYIIKNSEQDMIIPAVLEIHHKLLKLIKEGQQ